MKKIVLCALALLCLAPVAQAQHRGPVFVRFDRFGQRVTVVGSPFALPGTYSAGYGCGATAGYGQSYTGVAYPGRVGYVPVDPVPPPVPVQAPAPLPPAPVPVYLPAPPVYSPPLYVPDYVPGVQLYRSYFHATPAFRFNIGHGFRRVGLADVKGDDVAKRPRKKKRRGRPTAV